MRIVMRGPVSSQWQRDMIAADDLGIYKRLKVSSGRKLGVFIFFTLSAPETTCSKPCGCRSVTPATYNSMTNKTIGRFGGLVVLTSSM
jgi:hypothetical protein